MLENADIIEAIDMPLPGRIAEAGAYVVLVRVWISGFQRMISHKGLDEGVPRAQGNGIAQPVLGPGLASAI